jgi:hypothetical protein
MSICNLEDNNEFIYLIKEREFIKNNEEIYKIGKTKQMALKRIKDYPKNSILLLYIITNDCDKKEKQIIQKFKEHFIHKKDIGNEYFLGDYNHMINIILSIISNDSSLIESSLLESSLNDSSLIESSSVESSSNDSSIDIVYFDYDNKIINFDNSHIKDKEFIINNNLEYYELFELYYNKLFENDNNKIIRKTKRTYSTILTNTNKWINKMDNIIYPIIINNIAKNMKSFIEINFKDNVINNNNNNDVIINILCFLDYILKITSKNNNLYSHLNKYIDIIGCKYNIDDYKKYYELNIKQLKLLFETFNS